MRSYLTEAEVPIYLDRVRSAATVVDDPPPTVLAPDNSPDPDDDYLLDLGSTSGANYLVSGDRHLLDLEADMSTATAGPILSPREFLEELKRLR